MILCKEADGAICGKKCCCLECEQFKTCPDVCTAPSESCDKRFEESDKITVFEDHTAGIMAAIGAFALQKKVIEKQEASMRKQLQEAMEKYGVKSYETPEIKITYVAPTVRTSVDTAKLKKEMPEVAAKYSKTSNVSASIKITVKDE